MGRNGRIAAEAAFTWDAIGDQVLSVYHKKATFELLFDRKQLF